MPGTITKIKCSMQISMMKMSAPSSMLTKKNFRLADMISFEHSEQMSMCMSLEQLEKHRFFTRLDLPLCSWQYNRVQPRYYSSEHT